MNNQTPEDPSQVSRLPSLLSPRGLALLMALLVMAVAGSLRTESVDAHSRGHTGHSGNPDHDNGLICTKCHGGGDVPVVTLTGPDTVAPGSTNEYILQVAEGQRDSAGMNVSTTGGSLGMPSGSSDLKIQGGELTHNGGAKPVDSDALAIFTFLWTAPNTPGEVTLYGAGNSTNGDLRNSGDNAAAVTMLIQVSGDTPPTTEPTDEPTEMPTEMPTTLPTVPVVPTDTPMPEDTPTPEPPTEEPTEEAGSIYLPWLTNRE